MKIIFPLILALTLTFSAFCHAGVLVRDQLVTPLIPEMNNSLSIGVPPSFDPHKPIWVAYQIIGMSAKSKPEGEVVLESSFEGVPTPINELFVFFKAKDLKVDKSGGTMGEKLSALIGKRSPEELKKLMGDAMYEAYEAVNRKEGSYVAGTITKTHDLAGRKELVLLTNVQRATGIQPVLVSVIIGQGDIPAQYQGSNSLPIEKLLIGLISLIALIWFFRRR